MSFLWKIGCFGCSWRVMCSVTWTCLTFHQPLNHCGRVRRHLISNLFWQSLIQNHPGMSSARCQSLTSKGIYLDRLSGEKKIANQSLTCRLALQKQSRLNLVMELVKWPYGCVYRAPSIFIIRCILSCRSFLWLFRCEVNRMVSCRHCLQLPSFNVSVSWALLASHQKTHYHSYPGSVRHLSHRA